MDASDLIFTEKSVPPRQIKTETYDLIASRHEEDLYQLIVNTILGVLWLQLHFPQDDWDELLENNAVFDRESMDHMFLDAVRANIRAGYSYEEF